MAASFWIVRTAVLSAFGSVIAFAWGATAAKTLENDLIRADLGPHGLTTLADKATRHKLHLDHDAFAVTIDGATIASQGAVPAEEKSREHTLVYRFESGPWSVRVIYELQPGWHFLSKRLEVSSSSKTFHVRRVEVLAGELTGERVAEQRVRSAAFLCPPAETSGRQDGTFFALQNPFLQWGHRDGRVSVGYEPDMDWRAEYGPFESDRVCVGTYRTTGTRYPLATVPEWKFAAGLPPSGPSLDWAEIEALTDCERALLLDRRERSIRVNVGWCENDYQIDVGTPRGREEYKRVIDRAAEMGCRNVLFAPANSQLSNLKDNADAWGWENVLWLGLGQKIRKGEWEPHRDEVPQSVREMLDFARTKDVKLLAYVYPSLPFMGDPAWTAWIAATRHQQPGGYLGADTGQRGFQDWLLDQLVAFDKKAGVGGYSFDHWWIAYDGATSKYAQWYGCRRILEELRQRLPDVVIDGRQQYQQFGAWTWLAGSYPHPTGTDEQPQSFRAFPDLHFDRVSADRQRYAAWWYRVENFCPPEIMPGFITHQTPRNDARNGMPRERFRAKDWDVLGWRYSLLSSIATAPMNHVVNMIPARDEEEYKAFGSADQKWFRDWLDWTDQNVEVLRNVRPISNQPMLGRTDGAAAFKGDRGFVFLFNPNYRPLPAEFTLDASIGLLPGAGEPHFLIRQLYPDAEKGKLIGHPERGSWAPGDRVSIPLPGADAVVLEVTPVPPGPDSSPLLFGAAGTARMRDDRLELTGVHVEVGGERKLQVLVPPSQAIKSLTVNGASVEFSRSGQTVRARIRAPGERLGRCPQVGAYDPKFEGGPFHAEATIPRRVFDQLAHRRKEWPVRYTPDDLLATWLGSDRLLLFVNLADPADTMHVELKIDGKPAALSPAYSSIYPNVVERTFVGWYADVSSLAPDEKHAFDLTLPELGAGQFQGMFLDNVEAEFTDRLEPDSAGTLREP